MVGYSGTLVDNGGFIEESVSGTVNSTLNISSLQDTTLTVYVANLEFSNSSDFSALVTPTAGNVLIEGTIDNLVWRQIQTTCLD